MNMSSQTVRVLAGESQTVYAWIDGTADVIFDGLSSRDPDAKKLSYTLYQDSELVATGVTPAMKLPVGEYTMTLAVNNGVKDFKWKDFNVTVVEPLEVDSQISPPTTGQFQFKSEVMVTLHLPPDILRGDIDLYHPVCLYPGEMQALQQYLMRWRRRNKMCENLFAFFDKNVLMRTETDGGFVKLTAVGRLKTGRYFYGSDTVKVEELKKIPIVQMADQQIYSEEFCEANPNVKE